MSEKEEVPKTTLECTMNADEMIRYMRVLEMHTLNFTNL